MRARQPVNDLYVILHGIIEPQFPGKYAVNIVLDRDVGAVKRPGGCCDRDTVLNGDRIRRVILSVWMTGDADDVRSIEVETCARFFTKETSFQFAIGEHPSH